MGSSHPFLTAVTSLCDIVVDLRNLPLDPIILANGDRCYRADYDLRMCFGPGGIEFKLLSQGKVIGCVMADYC